MASYALRDLAGSIADIRLWGMITAKSIQIRYRRNVLGMLWLLIAFAVPALGIGYVLTILQGESFETHIPHVALGFAAWYFLSDTLVQGCKALTKNRNMLLQAPMHRSVFAFSTVIELTILLSVNTVAAMIISSAFGWRPGPEIIFLPLSFLIFMMTSFGGVLLLSIVSARLRDLSELISSVTRLALFFTPILWREGSRAFPDDSFLNVIASYNPMTYFVNLFRDPLVGEYPDLFTIAFTSGVGVLMVLAGLIALQKGGRSIAFFV